MAAMKPSGAAAGFTLVESLVVLAIIGLLGGIMALGVAGRLPGTGLDAAADAAIAELRHRQLEAMQGGVSVRFDPRKLDVVATATPARNRRLRLLSGVDMRVETPGPEPVLIFLPGGWSAGGRLHLRRGGTETVIRVDWPLGTVQREPDG